MTKKELVEQLQQFPDEYEVYVFISFWTKDGREINMGEVSEIEDMFENGPSVDLAVKSEAWKSAFDQAMLNDEDGNE